MSTRGERASLVLSGRSFRSIIDDPGLGEMKPTGKMWTRRNDLGKPELCQTEKRKRQKNEIEQMGRKARLARDPYIFLPFPSSHFKVCWKAHSLQLRHNRSLFLVD
jgi:hypothetical protein